jgi:hypothetical protein
VKGATYTNDGKSGGAMSFDGNTQVIAIKNAEDLQLQDFSIMAWVKRGSTEKTSNTWRDTVFFSYGQGGYGFGMRGNGQLFLTKVGYDGAMANCYVKDEDFHHIAMTKKGTKVIFYLDGVAYPAEEYGSQFEFSTDIGVGGRPDLVGGLQGSFLGVIDEVAVFNRPLSDEEIKSIYDSQK